jgi:RNA polymerase sigma factor (sigma-70 family)
MSERPPRRRSTRSSAATPQTRRRRDRNALVETHTGFAYHIANRYRSRGMADEDIRQVALLALVKAIDRFDPDHGAAFTSFAGRTIEGEIKRHFRDTAWSVRVPRSTKELHLAVRRAGDDLTHTLGRPPTVREIAAHLEVDTDDVVTALSASAAFTTASLDRPTDDDHSADRDGTLANRGRRPRRRRRSPPRGASHRHASRAGAGDRAFALLRGADTVRDRRTGGHEPDARVAAAAPVVRRDARRGELTRSRRHGIRLRFGRDDAARWLGNTTERHRHLVRTPRRTERGALEG